MNKLKVIGVLATLGGAVITLVSNWVTEKQTEETIDKKLNEKLAEKGL